MWDLKKLIIKSNYDIIEIDCNIITILSGLQIPFIILFTQ